MVIKKPVFRYSTLNAISLCKLFQEPDVYGPSSDDHTNVQQVAGFIDAALTSPNVYALGRNPRSEAIIFTPNHNSTTFQVHIAVRKKDRGKTVEMVVDASRWMINNTSCRSVVAFVRRSNGAVRSLIKKIGMREVGVLKGSVLFNGEYLDEVVYQITEQEFISKWSK